ncbi:hypothetical protein ACN47E_003794 [Coniothyrium glycines]
MASPKGSFLPFSQQLRLKQLGPNEWTTTHHPQKLGNPLNIAYGGYAIATACKAACLSISAIGPKYHLYSLLGNYLGPAYTDRPIHASVRTIRQTRTFATRQVEISQTQASGEKRVCLIAIADFQVAEPKTLMAFDKKPTKTYSRWQNCPTQTEAYQTLVDAGKVDQKLVDSHSRGFNLLQEMYDLRPCPEGIFAQNLYGVAKTLPHTQDNLESSERTTADWFRLREKLDTAVDHVTNLAFFIDSAIAFLPLSFNHLWFEDSGAVSSLDFALRVFQNWKEGSGEDYDSKGIDMNKWLLREMCSTVAGKGRSYGESWIWDEEGKAVACMSQQSILRPPPAQAKGML